MDTLESVFELLKKYMSHVRSCEGVDFVDDINNHVSDVVFDDTEKSVLMGISEEITEYINEYRNKEKEFYAHFVLAEKSAFDNVLDSVSILYNDKETWNRYNQLFEYLKKRYDVSQFVNYKSGK